MSNTQLITDVDLAKKLSVSRSYVHRLKSSGRLPEPVRLGRALRWPEKTIDFWIDLGCPSIHSDEWKNALYKLKEGDESGPSDQ